MSRVTYDAGTMTITVDGLEDVERALGDLKKKTPAAAKVAINATARQARKLMVAQAKARYAVNAAGRRHLKDLVQRKKATNTSRAQSFTSRRCGTTWAISSTGRQRASRGGMSCAERLPM